jgi:hypothetical protein
MLNLHRADIPIIYNHKYFAQNFKRLGLKKLISTSYTPNSKPEELTSTYQPALFELESPEYDEVKTRTNGKIFTLTRDITGDGEINFNDFEWEYLKGDGDFRSEEVTKLRDEATVVATNPPFSLFREFVSWIRESPNKELKFSMIGNMNAITYKEIFPLIKENKMWKFEDMDADHVSAWSKGGVTDAANCEMLCKPHNRAKGNK